MELLEQKDRGMLARIGFFLCRDGLVPEAETVFQGLAESAPEKDGAVVGLALCWIIKGECEKAIEAIDKRLERGSPIASSLMLYKLTALGLAGRLGEAKSLREQMMRDGFDKAVESADQLLAELDRIKSQSA